MKVMECISNMNHTTKRSANTPVPVFGGNKLAPLCDSLLIEKVLTLPLGDAFREELEEMLTNILPGKFGQLKRDYRDRLLKFGMQNGALPKPVKPIKGRVMSSNAPDAYDVRETKGTRKAMKLIAQFVPSMGGKMPAPPGRKSA